MRSRFTIILLITFFYAGASFPQHDINEEIHKGLDQCYNFYWEKAEDTFQKIIEKYPEDMRGYHFESSIYLWYFLSSNRKNDLQDFVAYSNLAIEKASNILTKDPGDEIALYFLGANYNYRAIAFAKADKFLDAVWATKKSESYLSETIKLNPKVYDAYLGLGLYNFAVAQIPSTFQWALNLAGIKGNMHAGLGYIRETAQNGNFSKVEAQYYFSQILSNFIVNYDSSSFYLKNLIKKFPSNLIFNYAYGVVKIKERHLDAAEKVLLKIVKADNPKFQKVISFSNFLMGDIFYRRNDFDSAKYYYNKFLTSAEDKDYTGIASYRLAVCYEVTGDRENSLKYFEQAANGNMDLEDDIYAKRKSEIYSKRAITNNEIELIKGNNLIENGRYKEAYNQLYALIDSLKQEQLKAEDFLLLSEASYQMGSQEEALSFATTAKSLKTENEKWIKPYAAYYIARIFKNKKDNTEAEKYIEEVYKYKNYDYRQRLRRLIYSLSKDE